MTTARWEYATVAWTHSIREVYRSDSEWERLPEKTRRNCEEKGLPSAWWQEQTLWIWLPGATEPDKRPIWSTGESGHKTSPLAVLNELGADGWEVTSQLVRSSTMTKHLGWVTAGYPIQVTTLLKRQVA